MSLRAVNHFMYEKEDEMAADATVSTTLPNFEDHEASGTHKDISEILQTPGILIQSLITPVDPKTTAGDRLRGRKRRKAGVAAALRIMEPEEMRTHINTLRGDVFDPQLYQEKGYFLRGSIRTNGFAN
ncbi:hypothetical protein BGW42_001269 [Actinomortierella wolfii]|nr:hypothetical protein BGW42_001269 [Actinomortierella wolfii]